MEQRTRHGGHLSIAPANNHHSLPGYPSRRVEPSPVEPGGSPHPRQRPPAQRLRKRMAGNPCAKFGAETGKVFYTTKPTIENAATGCLRWRCSRNGGRIRVPVSYVPGFPLPPSNFLLLRKPHFYGGASPAPFRQPPGKIPISGFAVSRFARVDFRL